MRKYMVVLVCRNCSFKYSPRGNAKIPERCGNCGGYGCMNVQPDAEQILRESDYL